MASVVGFIEGGLGVAPESLARAKDELSRLTRRNLGIALERMIGVVDAFATGWVTYFGYAAHKSALLTTALLELEEWLRRKLRCVRLSSASAPSRCSTSW